MEYLVNKIAVIVGTMVIGLSMCVNAGDSITLDGSTTVGPIAKAFAGYYMKQHPDTDVSISMTGSGSGAKSLMQGACDIANMSRFMKPQEYKKAVQNGIQPVPHMVALDGIAVVVHPRNPVSELSLDDVKDIYTGKVTNWKTLGGPDIKIVKVSRDTSSGTYEVFSDLALQGAAIKNAEYVKSNGAARSRVSNTKAAIAYVGLGFLNGVKAVTLEGVKPNMKTVGSGAYPLARPLFMWTDGFPELGGNVFQFIMMKQSDVGKQIIKDIGFVPVGG